MNGAPKPHDTVPPTPPATVIGEDAEQVGTVIGSYKLMELIGEGGFGLVFVAEQQKPVRRRVALKVIRAPQRKEVEVAISLTVSILAPSLLF
jgi:hypothetical protein